MSSSRSLRLIGLILEVRTSIAFYQPAFNIAADSVNTSKFPLFQAWRKLAEFSVKLWNGLRNTRQSSPTVHSDYARGQCRILSVKADNFTTIQPSTLSRHSKYNPVQLTILNIVFYLVSLVCCYTAIQGVAKLYWLLQLQKSVA